MLKHLFNTNNMVNQHLVLVSALYTFETTYPRSERNLTSLQKVLRQFISAPKNTQETISEEQFNTDMAMLYQLWHRQKLSKQDHTKLTALKNKYLHIELMVLLSKECSPVFTNFLTDKQFYSHVLDNFIRQVSSASLTLFTHIKSYTSEPAWGGFKPKLVVPETTNYLEYTKRHLHQAIHHYGVTGFKVGLYNTDYTNTRKDPLLRSALEMAAHLSLVGLSLTMNLLWLGYVDPVWLRMVIGAAINIGELMLHIGMRRAIHGHLITAHEANEQYHDETQKTLFQNYKNFSQLIEPGAEDMLQFYDKEHILQLL